MPAEPNASIGAASSTFQPVAPGSAFLSSSIAAGSGADVAKVADHADYLKKIGGAGVVALGSDFDGLIKTPEGLTDAGDIPNLWAELKRRGWTEDELRGVQGANFMRTWQAVIDAAGEPHAPR